MIKAVREAKVHTSWVAVNDQYEHAVTSFVDDILADGDNLFIEDLRQQQNYFHWFGLLNSVTLTIVKLTSPGVPDFYQGNELLDFSMVDPDNRRPIDYPLRRRLLAELEALARQPSQQIEDALPAMFAAANGRAKLWVVRCLLDSRRRHRALYQQGDYRPLKVSGARAGNVVAYMRRFDRQGLLVVAGRLFTQLGRPVGTLPVGVETWDDTTVDTEGVGQHIGADERADRRNAAGRTVPAAGSIVEPLSRRRISLPLGKLGGSSAAQRFCRPRSTASRASRKVAAFQLWPAMPFGSSDVPWNHSVNRQSSRPLSRASCSNSVRASCGLPTFISVRTQKAPMCGQMPPL